VPREPVPLTLFIQISLAIHTRPSAQPAMNRKASHTGTGPKRHEQQYAGGEQDAGDDAALESQAPDDGGIERAAQDDRDQARGGHRTDGKARVAQPAQGERDQGRLKAENEADPQAAGEHRREHHAA
jgi:hypothetical protein